MAGAYNIGKLVWQITGDTSGIKRSLSDTENSAKKTAGTLSGIASTIKSAFAIGAVVMFGKSIAKAASDAQETSQKFGVVFSKIQDDAQKAAKSLQEEFNFSSQAAMELLSGTGNLLQGLGYTQDAALGMSEKIAQLGSDLTSMNNYAGGAAEATKILTKALLGEREALQALDLKVTDDQLRAYARSLGTTWDALTQAEKAQATYNIIMAQSVNAIGDVERSTTSAAYTWRKLENLWADIKVSLGNEVLPVLTELGQTLISTAGDATPLLEAFKFIIKDAGFVVKEISLLINVVNSFGKAVGVMNADTKATAARKNMDVFMSALKIQYKDIIALENKRDGTSRSLIKTLEHLATAHKDATAAYNLQYFKNLQKDFTDTADVMEDRVDDYTDNLKKIDIAYQDNTKNLEKTISDKIKARKKEAEENKKAFIESQKFMGGASASNAKAKAEMDELTQRQIQYGQTLSTRAALESYINKLEKEANDAALKGEDKKEAAIRKSISALKDLSEQMERTWDDLSNEEKFNRVNELSQMTGNSIMAIIQSVADLQNQIYQNRIADLDEQMQAELEAAGVAEKTDVEKAQEAYDNTKTEENRKALVKAQIEEKYQKKKQQLEYESALTAWQYQVALAGVQVPVAVLNAISAGWKFGPIVAAAYGIAAGIAGGIQVAAIKEAKPKAPKFALGGIVPGNSHTGDNVLARVNSGEMVLNAEQQSQLFNMVNGGGKQYSQLPPMSSESLWDLIFKASKNGDLLIAESAVTAR